MAACLLSFVADYSGLNRPTGEKAILRLYKILFEMRINLLVLIFPAILLSTSIMAQAVETRDIMKRIELDSFSNRLALDMGMRIVELAKSRNLKVAVEICRLNHTIFLYVDDELPADKHNWLRRKANVAKHFEESSLRVKHDLIEGAMTLEKTFALAERDFLARGGSIPVFVKSAGMVATITVSGLRDEDDHQIIVDALQGRYF